MSTNYTIEEFDGGCPEVTSSIKQRTTIIKCKDLRIIAHLLDIPIDYLVNWTYSSNDKRVYLTDGIKITYDARSVVAVIETEESIIKTLRSRSCTKKMSIPPIITEIMPPPLFYHTDESVVVTHEFMNLPYTYFECAKSIVPYGTPLPETEVFTKVKSVEAAVLIHKPGLLLREKIYHMLPAKRITKLSFQYVNSSLVIDTAQGKEYKFPMSCRDTWALLSEHINSNGVVCYADERTYPASIIVELSTFLRLTREIELLFKPFLK